MVAAHAIVPYSVKHPGTPAQGKRTNMLIAYALLGLCAALAASDPIHPETVAPGATLVPVFRDNRFFEGPTWDPGTQKLYFTAFGKTSQILRLDGPGRARVWLDRSQGVNGTCLSREGRLLGAQVDRHRIISYGIGAEGPTDVRVLYENPHLNQPNDVCQALSGDIYFTDPDFERRRGSAVYLLRQGKAAPVITDMPLPNGLKTSRDGRTLYVSDSQLKLWRSYPVRADGTVGPGQVFFNPDAADRTDPDGLTLDERGNLYGTGRGGIWVVRPDGRPLGLVRVPDFCSNVTFGGSDGRSLYITGRGVVYRLAMRVRGWQFVR